MTPLTSAAIIAAVAFLIPLARRAGRLPLPEPALEIVLGALIGPQLLGWASIDPAVQVLSAVGLCFLLLLSGLEIDIAHLRGALLGVTAAAFTISIASAFGIGSVLAAAGLVQSPWLIAVILSATSLGIILPVLQDSDQVGTPLGRTVIAGASIAETVPVILLSVLFATEDDALGARLTLLAAFLLLVAVVAAVILGVGRVHLLSNALHALQETTAEIRVRGVFALLLVFACLATRFGLAAILGAFLAGAALKIADRDEAMTHSLLPVKLKAVGFGVFIPYFFITTGMSLDVRALTNSTEAIAQIPLFLGALLLTRGVPALLYRRLGLPGKQVVAAGLLQATSLSLPAVAGTIGVELGLLKPATYVALITAGLISVLAFPPLAMLLARRSREPQTIETS